MDSTVRKGPKKTCGNGQRVDADCTDAMAQYLQLGDLTLKFRNRALEGVVLGDPRCNLALRVHEQLRQPCYLKRELLLLVPQLLCLGRKRLVR